MYYLKAESHILTESFKSNSFLANLAVNNKAEELNGYFDQGERENDKDNFIKKE